MHDVNNEGFYVGPGGDASNFTDCVYRYGVVARCGGEGFQMNNMGNGNKIYQCAFIAPGLEYEDPFQGPQIQDKNIQFSFQNGNIEFYNNICIGSGSSQFILLPENQWDIARKIRVFNNFFGAARQKLMRINNADFGNSQNFTEFQFDRNFVGNYDDSNVLAVLDNTTTDHYADVAEFNMPIKFSNSSFDLSQKVLLNNGGASNMSFFNLKNEVVQVPQFVNSGYPDDFNWRRLKFYAFAYIRLSNGFNGQNNPILQKDITTNGDFPDIIYYHGKHYEVIQTHYTHDGIIDSGIIGNNIIYPDMDVNSGDGVTGTYYRLIRWDSEGRWSLDENFTTSISDTPPNDYRTKPNTFYANKNIGLGYSPYSTNKTQFIIEKAFNDGNDSPDLNNIEQLVQFKSKKINKIELFDIVGLGNFYRIGVRPISNGGLIGAEIYGDWNQII